PTGDLQGGLGRDPVLSTRRGRRSRPSRDRGPGDRRVPANLRGGAAVTGAIDTAGPAPATHKRPGRSRAAASDLAKRERRAAYLFLSPNLIGLTVFVAVPMLLSIVLAFFSV